MRLFLIVGLFLGVTVSINAQQRYATASGSWTGAIWASTPAGAPGSATTPTATDDVYTNGRQITTTSNVTCKNLYVTYNQINSITLGNLRTLTITGTLSGYDDANTVEEFPTTTVLSFGTSSSLIFTAANVDPAYDPYVIYFWDNTVPLGRTTFNFGNGVTKSTILPLVFTNLLRVQTGDFAPDLGAPISGSGGAAALQIDIGASLTTSDPISSFMTASISGTLSTSESVDISGTFTMSSTGVFNTSYTNPSGGWWLSASPTTVSLNASSTINFNRTGSQNISPLTYGNITLSGSGTITKTLTGAGTLNVQGTLTIASSSTTFNSNSASAITIGGNVSNAGTWAPTDLVTFNGTGAQSIGGTATVSFNGGLEVNKSAGTLTLNRAVNISNGLTISQGTLNLGSQTVTLNSGNIDNDGTFTVGSSTFIVNGTTSITGTSPVSFNNLQVGASGNLSANGTVNISGNLSNAGSFNVNSVSLNGSVAQNITGSYSFSNITVSNTAGVTNNGSINLTGALDLGASGVFDADGSGSGVLTLISTSLTTGGRIATLSTPSNFSGNITVQRFVDGPDDWRYFSVPFISANVGQWQATFPVTGNFSNPSPNGVNGVVCSTCPSIYSWNAATQQYVAVGSGASTGTTSLSHLTGYSAYSYLTGSFTLSMSGTPVKSGVSIPLATGYNLIPNPYPSPIDWDNVTTTGTTNTVYMTTAQGSFATYLKGSGTCTGCNFNSNWRGELAIGQSFWIESSGASSVGLTEAAKTTGATFVREEDAKDLFRITLQSEGKNDDLILHFDPQATTGTELDLDARKRSNDFYINLSSYNTNASEDYAINTIPYATCESGTVKLKMSGISNGEHSLSFTELDKMTLGYTITLKDNFLNQQRVVTNDFLYNFLTNDDAASKADGRFELFFTSPTIQPVATSSLKLASECGSNIINVALENTQLGVTYQLMLGDTQVSSDFFGNGDVVQTMILSSALNEGINQLALRASSVDGCQQQVFESITSFEKVSTPQLVIAAGDQVCSQESATLTATGDAQTVAYRWYDSATAEEALAQTTSGSWMIEGVEQSKEYYVAALNKYGCESFTRMKVNVEVTTVTIPQISTQQTTLISSSLTGNQWYRNGELIPGATEASYDAQESGSYSVMVTINSCSATSEEVILSITSLEEESNGVSVYPNPANERVTIKLPENVLSRLKNISFNDVRNVAIRTYGKEDVQDGVLTIDLEGVSRGIYFANIKTQDTTLIYRIIKK